MLLLTLAGGARAKEGRVLAYVSVEGADRVVAVDVATRKIVRRMRVPDGPHNIDADGISVVVTSPPAGKVTVLHPRTLGIRRVFSGFGFPHDVEARGRLVFVTDEARGELAILDLGSGKVRRIAVGPRPHDLVVDGDMRAYVTHRGPRLTVVDTVRGRVVGRIAAGGAAHDIDRAPDTAKVYVTYWDKPGVGLVDVGRRTVRWTRRFGGVTHHVALDHFRPRLWVSDHAGGRIHIASSRTGRLVRSLGGCPGAHHVAVATPIRAVAACHDSGALAVYGPRRRIGFVEVGPGPHGVAVGRVP